MFLITRTVSRSLRSAIHPRPILGVPHAPLLLPLPYPRLYHQTSIRRVEANATVLIKPSRARLGSPQDCDRSALTKTIYTGVLITLGFAVIYSIAFFTFAWWKFHMMKESLEPLQDWAKEFKQTAKEIRQMVEAELGSSRATCGKTSVPDSDDD